MTLTKYEEIMEHIAVTPQMRQRVLEGVSAALAGTDHAKKSRILPFSGFRKYLSAAACLAVLVIGALTYRSFLPGGMPESVGMGGGNPETGQEEAADAETQVLAGARQDAAALPEQEAMGDGGFAITEAADVQELAQLVGFPVSEPEELPFEVTEKTYLAFGSDLAEITCTGESGTLTFRKSGGTEDNSGDYNEYETETQTQLNGVSVTLKGNGGRVCLAVWTDGQYAYSVAAQQGLAEPEILALAQQFGW